MFLFEHLDLARRIEIITSLSGCCLIVAAIIKIKINVMAEKEPITAARKTIESNLQEDNGRNTINLCD